MKTTLITVTDLARERAPSLVARAGALADELTSVAVAAGVQVREFVIRGDKGVVVDIFAVGDIDALLGFWGAATEALRSNTDGVEVSVMVHA